MRDQAAVDAAVAEAIERLGGLDVLINNAGIGIPQSAGEPPDDDALAVLDVNLLGPWRVTAAALPALRESRGRVVNVASGLAHLDVPFATAYCMSKRGLVAYSDALRLEHGDAITVTTVYPGYIRTPIHDARGRARASGSRASSRRSRSPTPPARSCARRSARRRATSRRRAAAPSATRSRGASRGALLDRVIAARGCAGSRARGTSTARRWPRRSRARLKSR